MIETALVLLLLLSLVFGITEFGRALYVWNSLNSLARGAARVAIVTPNLPAAPETTLTCPAADTTGDNAVYNYLCNNRPPAVSPLSNVKVTIDVTQPSGTARSGNALTGDSVTITVKLTGFTSLVPKLVPITNTLTGVQTMRYE